MLARRIYQRLAYANRSPSSKRIPLGASGAPLANLGFSRYTAYAILASNRGVAQLGSAPAWGAGGRWFESSLPDFHKPCFYNCAASRTILTSDMAASTVELAELLNVIGSKRDDLTVDSLTTISPNNSRSGITTIRIWAEAPGSKSTRLHDIRPADSEDTPCDVTI